MFQHFNDSSELLTLLASRILSLPNVKSRKSKWQDRQAFFINGREFAHFHSYKQIDIRLTKAYQKTYRYLLEGDMRIKLRNQNSHWLIFEFETEDDILSAFQIIQLAYEANISNF